MNSTQKATIPAGLKSGNISKTNRRDQMLYGFAVVDLDAPVSTWDPETVGPVVELRVYGTKATNSVCVWISCGGQYGNGSGKATGSGYHRPSAAAQYALTAAGVVFSEPIDGRGDDAIRGACMAVARALGVKRPALLGYGA